MTNKIKYIITAVFVGAILFWALHYWINRNSYLESEYFISYFPFAHRSYTFEDPEFYLKKLKLEKVTIDNNQTAVIRLPMDCQLDYYMKIPRGAALKLLLKHYGRRKLKALEEVKISAQEQNKQMELVHSIRFPKGPIANQWKTEHISLDRYGDKIIKLTFSAVRYGGSSELQEGFLIRPLLMLQKHNLPSQNETASSIQLDIKAEKLKQTNVIMIVLDAARPDHFSCYGYHRNTTPYIDQLAQESVMFRNAFSVASYTVPSTTSLFTSLYPDTHRILSLEERIPKGMNTFAEVLRKKAYETYASGFIIKWARKGFQKTFDLFIHNENKFKQDLHNFLDKAYSNNNPSFIYIHLRPPHSDYDPPDKFDKWSDKKSRITFAGLTTSPVLMNIDKEEKGLSKDELQFLIDRYDGTLLWGDWLVHLLLEAFKKYGIYDNSLIILTSDHGEAFLEHGKLLHNSTVYNEMIRIPLIIKFPSYILPKKRIAIDHIENIDLMPTVLDFLKIEYKNLNLQGKSLLPLLFSNVQRATPYLFSRAAYDGIFSLADSRFKYIQWVNRGELYDIRNDPEERKDLANAKPILLGYYRSLAFFYRQQLIKAHTERPEEAQLDKETIMKLRALGYLQ